MHHLLERILDEYIVAAGLQSGQPLFQSINSVETAVTGRSLNRYNARVQFGSKLKGAGFNPCCILHLAGNRHNDLRWKMTDD